MKKFVTVMVLGILLIGILNTANAVVPNIIPVGGMLADTDGQPLDGAYDVAFALYDVETGGTSLWSESRTGDDAVTVENGMFTVYLGEVSGDLDFSALMGASGLWLGMTIGTDSEMNRIYLGTVPYAMEAQQCEVLADPAGQGIATQSWVGAQGYVTNDTNTNAMTECVGEGVYLDAAGNCASIAPTDLSAYATQAWVTGQLSDYMPQLDGTTCAYGIADIDEFGAITCAANSVAAHEAAYGHVTPAQATALTGGEETALHSHSLAAAIPSGVIVMWSGTIDSIPSGWALCDGTNGTPDLTDRFVMGVAAAEEPGDTGGESSYSLTVDQLPAHSHTAETDIDTGHIHSGSTSTDGSHKHELKKQNYTCSSGSQYVSFVDEGMGNNNAVIVSNGNHSHTLSISTAGAHSHAVTVDNTGSGAPIDNRPAYFKLAFIMKL